VLTDTEDILRGVDAGVHKSENVEVLFHEHANPACYAVLNDLEDILHGVSSADCYDEAKVEVEPMTEASMKGVPHAAPIAEGHEIHEVVLLSECVLLSDVNPNHCMPIALQDGKLAKDELVADLSMVQERIFSVHPGMPF